MNRRTRTIRDEAGIVAKYGVPPVSIPDYLALVGDAADGYPGLRGWGTKSAAAVLARYGHLESIPDDWRRWGVNAANPAALNEVDKLRDAFVERTRQALANPVAEANEIRALQTAFDSYYTEARGASARMMGGESGDALLRSLQSMKARHNAVQSILDHAVERDRAAIAAAFKTTRTTQRLSTTTIMVVVVLFVAMLVIVSLHVAFLVAQSIRRAVSAVQAVAAGDLTVDFPIESTDETGDLL